MQRIPHDQNGVWIQQFKYMNSNPLAKRYYLDNASFLVYSVLLEAPTESQEILITYPTLDVGNEIEIKFGQFVTPQRNLQLFRKFYFDFDISLNKKGRFHSFPEEEEFAEAGLGEYFNDTALCLVEWPGKAGAYLPPADLVLRFDFSDAGRILELRAASESGCQCLNLFCSPNAAS